MKKLSLFVALLAMLVLFNSCDNPLGLEKKVKVTTSLDFKTVLQESRLIFAADGDYNLTISNSNELDDFVMKYLPHISARPFTKISAQVDFEKEMLIVVGCGMRSSGSDYIEVKSVYSNGKQITVYAKEVISSIGTTDIGYPVHIVKILKSDLPVEFAKREIVKQEPVDDNFGIPFVTLIQGSHEVISDGSFNSVLKNQSDADNFIKSYKTNQYDANGNPIGIKLPKIDFNKEMILVLHAGTQSSGSNKLSIEKVLMMNGTIYVYSVLYIPEIGTDDIGYPVHIVSVPKYDTKVEFVPSRIEKLSGNPDDDGNNNPINELQNSKWELYSWTNATGETVKFQDIQFFKEEPYFTPENFYISFDSNLNFSGKAGCNEFKGIYKADNGYMGIGNLGSTKMNCFMTSEFMMGLNGAYKYYFTDKTILNIMSSDSNMNVMTFVLSK